MTENALDFTGKIDEPTLVGQTSEGVNLYLDEPTSISVREDRHRQKFSRKPLDQLIDSMRDVGQLQPGLCRWNEEGRIELVVGERRLRACLVLKKKFLYIIKDELKDKLLLEQAQLDENLIRSDLTWQEEIIAKSRLHTILQERFGKAQPGVRGGHSLKDTAEYLGSKIATLSEDVTLATFLTIEEVAAAPNKTVAKKIAKKLIENVNRQEAIALALKKEEKPYEPTEEERAEAKLEHKRLLDKLAQAGKTKEEAHAEATKIMEQKLAPKTKERDIQEQQLIYFNKRCLLGTMEDKILTFPDGHFDIICFDPPWGVEFDKVFKNTGTTKQYEDNAEAYLDSLPKWLDLIWQKLAENSHLYMFFSITNHQFVYDQLERVGFSTNRMPLIWHKKGAHTTRNPTIWPGRAYEPIAYARKGDKPLQRQGAPDVITTPMPTPSIKDIHPSAKHPQIYKELLERSAKPADKVLDPMAGSGMFGVACEALRDNFALDWQMIEMDNDFKNLQLINLMKGYVTITGESGNMKPLDIVDMDKVKGFEELTPGTPAWSQYFKSHPEEQDAMLEWRQKQGK